MIKTTISMVNSPLNNKPSMIFSFRRGPNGACATGPGTQSTCSISCFPTIGWHDDLVDMSVSVEMLTMTIVHNSEVF